MAWDKDVYEAKRLAYNAAQDEKRKHERVAKALETLRECGVIGKDEDLSGLAKLREEHELFSQALIDVDDEVKEARLAVDADHQAAELARLQQGLRDRDWRDAWREIARESGMNPKAIDHAWRHHGPPADTDEPDRQGLGALVEQLRTEHDYLWPSAPATPPADPPAARETQPAAAVGGPRFVFSGGQWRSSNGSAP